MKRLKTWLAVELAALLALAACAPQAPAPQQQQQQQQQQQNVHLPRSTPSKTYTPATPEPGTDIPSVTVTDAGITIEPGPYGVKTPEDQWVSILLNRQVDINTATCSSLLPPYKTTDQLKCTGLAATFYDVMLANPKLHLKTVSDYAQAGGHLQRRASSGLDSSGRESGVRSRRRVRKGV